MSAELLLPFMRVSTDAMGAAVKAGKPIRASEAARTSRSLHGFNKTLEAAKRAIDMTTREPCQPQVWYSMGQDQIPLQPGKEEEVNDSDLTGYLPVAGNSMEKVPVEAGLIPETGMILMATGESLTLTGLPPNPALPETMLLTGSNGQHQELSINPASPQNSGMFPGMAIEKPPDDPKMTLIAGSDVLVNHGENTADKAPFLSDMESDGNHNQQMSRNQAERMESTPGSKTGEGRDPFQRAENRTTMTSTADTGQSPKVGNSQTLNPASLITAESEKMRGVKTQVTSGNEVVAETSQVLTVSSPAETVVTEKVETIQKPVSTGDIVEQIVRKIEFYPGQKSSAVTIKLEPEFLGNLQINLEVVDDVLVARFSTDNHQVKQLLEMGMGQLRTQLETTGIRLERAEVNVDLGQHQGEYQHHHQPGYQNRQPLPYEVSHYYPVQFMSDTGPSETVENYLPPGDYSDGSVNYLI